MPRGRELRESKKIAKAWREAYNSLKLSELLEKPYALKPKSPWGIMPKILRVRASKASWCARQVHQQKW